MRSVKQLFDIEETEDHKSRAGWHTPPEKVNQVVEDLHIEMIASAQGIFFCSFVKKWFL